MRIAALLLFVLPSLAAGQTAGARLYDEANRLYADGRYQEACDRYHQAVGSGIEDARLYYNLGNACFKCGKIGEAILWYERARRLAPRGSDILHNLRFVNAVKKDREPEERNVVWRALGRAFAYPTLNELCVGFSALGLGLFALGAVRLLSTGRPGVPWVILFTVMVCLELVDGVWLGSRLYARGAIHEAILVASEEKARAGPEQGQTVVFVAHEGTKFRIERRQGEWLLVRLANGLGGWMPRKALEEI